MTQKKYIELKNVTKDYGSGAVIKNLNVSFDKNAFTVILGPSGCGKSTLMNMIAGLETVTGGEIYIDGAAVQDQEPKKRGLAMVFQNYALYPHMTVADNIGYAMKVAKVKKAERHTRIAEVAKIVDLSHLLDRRPSQLSGGQQQRVAIARAIVRKPKVILYDEPLSNLDAKLRHEMRVELTDLHHDIRATSIFVTHDQIEAMTLADKIMILNNGVVEQYDTPEMIYNRPASVFVAQFIGTPAMNIVPLSAVQGLGSVLINWQSVCDTHNITADDVLLGMRAEKIIISDMPMDNTIVAKVSFVENMGAYSTMRVVCNGVDMYISIFENTVPSAGDTIYISCLAEDLHFFNKHTHARI